MSEAPRDQNHVPALLFESDSTSGLTIPAKGDQTTGRLFVDMSGGGSGTVTDVSVVTANGISGSVATSTTTPAITLTLGSITPSAVQISGLTASEIVGTDASKNLVSLAVATYPSLTELSYLKGATSAIQTQITAKMTNPMTTGGDIIYGGASGVPTRLANGSAGQVLQSNGTTLAPSWVAAGTGDVTKVGTPVNNQVGVWTGDGTLEGDADLTFDTATNTLSAGTFLGTALTASELLGTDGSKNIVSLAVATYPSLTELTYVKGVTSAIQTQINAKAPSTSPTFATSVTGSYLTASEILITDGSKNIVSAPVATYPSLTELSYVKGLTSSAQTQITAALPKAGGTVTGTVLLAEGASIGLDPAGSADGAYSGVTVTATAGYAQAFGDLVYLDPTDSRWEAADANAAAGADGDARGMLGMVVVAGTDGNSCTILLNGIIRADAKFPAFTVNNPIYASETAGSVTQTQPTTTDVVIRIVGAALTADEMYFNPDWTYTTHT